MNSVKKKAKGVRRMVKRWLHLSGYRKSYAVIDDGCEYETHIKLQDHYQSVSAGQELEKHIIQTARRSLHAAFCNNESGTKLQLGIKEYEDKVKPLPPLNVALSDYSKALTRMEKIIDDFSSRLSSEIIGPLLEKANDLDLKSTLLHAEKFSRTRQNMKAVFDEYDRRKLAAELSPSRENQKKLLPYQRKVEEYRSELCGATRTSNSLATSFALQQQDIFKSLTDLVGAEADYHSEILQKLTQLQHQLLLAKDMKKYPSAPLEMIISTSSI